MSKTEISDEYILGLVEGEGTFTFSSSNISGKKRKVPAFSIKMHFRDRRLIEEVRDKLGLKNRVYVYDHKGHDGAKRSPQAMLIVREFGSIKNVIIPFFYKKLRGNKAIQFEDWLERIGHDPDVPTSFRLIYRMYKSGFYGKNSNLRLWKSKMNKQHS